MPQASRYHHFLKALADKLNNGQVLFFSGAGLSVNWRGRLGKDLAKSMLDDFKRSGSNWPEVRAWVEDFEKNKTELPLVSELLAQNKCWYIRRYLVPDEAGQPGASLSPSLRDIMSTDPVAAGHIGIPHITLARLAKEGLLTEIMTTNVDMLHEAACEAVGMKRIDVDAGNPALHFPWVEGYHTVTDRHGHARMLPSRKLLTIHKIHGCLDATRQVVAEQNRLANSKGRTHQCGWSQMEDDCLKLHQKNHNLVFTYRELLNWRSDHWAHDLMADRARSHHVVFAGFAVADAVLHALFRDVFEEVMAAQDGNGQPDTPQVLGADPPQCSVKVNLRAQMITRDKTVQATAVLMAANHAGPLGDDRQLALINGKQDLEELFMGIYNSAVSRLLLEQVRVRGYSIIERWVQAEAGKSKVELVRERCKQLLDFLQNVVQQWPEFLYHTLPGALRFSWLATEPALRWGLPEEDDSRNPYESRYASPHYYVPLSKRLDLTLLLLRAYYVLLGGPEPQLNDVQFLPGGWVRFSAMGERQAVAVLPILSPMEANLPLMSRVRAPAPPPRTPALLLEILRTGQKPPEGNRSSLADPAGFAPLDIFCMQPLDRTQLFTGDGWPDMTPEQAIQNALKKG